MLHHEAVQLELATLDMEHDVFAQLFGQVFNEPRKAFEHLGSTHPPRGRQCLPQVPYRLRDSLKTVANARLTQHPTLLKQPPELCLVFAHLI